MYSSTLSLTSALGGVGGKLNSATSTPGKTRYPLYRVFNDPGPVWTNAESLTPSAIRFSDRPARSESLYRLNYSGPQ
jgi:hypothetical protein